MSLVTDTKETGCIATLIEPAVAARGFELVRVTMLAGARQTLQVMVERADGETVGVDDCAELSRMVSALLDVEDPIVGAYDLEVSSPGIDRPLTRRKDFERFAGFEAKLELSEARQGRRRFRGRLLGLEGAAVRLDAEGEVLTLPLDAIRRAKLVLTDDLLAAAGQPRRPN